MTAQIEGEGKYMQVALYKAAGGRQQRRSVNPS